MVFVTMVSTSISFMSISSIDTWKQQHPCPCSPTTCHALSVRDTLHPLTSEARRERGNKTVNNTHIWLFVPLPLHREQEQQQHMNNGNAVKCVLGREGATFATLSGRSSATAAVMPATILAIFSFTCSALISQSDHFANQLHLQYEVFIAKSQPAECDC